MTSTGTRAAHAKYTWLTFRRGCLFTHAGLYCKLPRTMELPRTKRAGMLLALSAISLFTPGLPVRVEAQAGPQYVEAMSGALDRVISMLGGAGPRTRGQVNNAPQNSLVFSANMNFAHRKYIKYCSNDTLFAYADALKEAGAKRVDINPGLWPWSTHDQENIAKYDALVRHIREIGLELAWNPSYWPEDAHITTLADWDKAALPVYAEMARRYKPDIFSVIHEPTTMNQRMGIHATPEEWRRLAQNAAKVVQEASPKTRIAAGALHWEVPYFDQFGTIPDVEFLTVDIYFLKGLPTFAKMAQSAHQYGKGSYIEETWRFAELKLPSAGGRRVRDVSNEIYEDLDIKWLTAMVLFALKNNLSAVTPFWSTAFFTYLPGTWDASDRHFFDAVVGDIKRGKRTRYFQKYRELAQQYGR